MPKPTLLAAPQQQRSRQALRAVLDAGCALLRQSGMEGVTVRSLAQESGVSVGNIYRIFGDKNRLLLSIYAEFMGGAAQRLRQRIDELPDDADPRKFVASAVALIARHYRRGSMITRDVLNFGADNSEFRAIGSEYGRLHGEMLARRLERYGALIVQPDPDAAIAFCHRLMFDCLVMQAAYKGEGSGLPPESWDSLQQRLTDVITTYLFGAVRAADARCDAAVGRTPA